MLKDAQTNLKGNFEIIGKRDPELWDRGYFICYKDETDNVMRIADHKIANEMMEILYSATENKVNGG